MVERERAFFSEACRMNNLAAEVAILLLFAVFGNINPLVFAFFPALNTSARLGLMQRLNTMVDVVFPMQCRRRKSRV